MLDTSKANTATETVTGKACTAPQFSHAGTKPLVTDATTTNNTPVSPSTIELTVTHTVWDVTCSSGKTPSSEASSVTCITNATVAKTLTMTKTEATCPGC